MRMQTSASPNSDTGYPTALTIAHKLGFDLATVTLNKTYSRLDDWPGSKPGTRLQVQFTHLKSEVEFVAEITRSANGGRFTIRREGNSFTLSRHQRTQRSGGRKVRTFQSGSPAELCRWLKEAERASSLWAQRAYALLSP